MPDRIYNFAAGPATLPLEVLEEAQAEFTNINNSGMSLLEMSHRSQPVEIIMSEAEADIREVGNIPENYHVLFLQGGASQQFSMVPMNLLSSEGHAEHIVTGHFAKLAYQDAQKIGNIQLAASTEEDKFSRIPSLSLIHI